MLPTVAAVERLLATALDLGISHFDTAPIYGRGYSEKLLGSFLTGRRDRVTLATKVGLGYHRGHALAPGVALPLNALRRMISSPPPRPIPSPHPPPLTPRQISRADVERSFDGSRRALRTDYFDVYLLHEALPSFLEEAALEFLVERRNAGLIRCLGVAAGGHNYRGLDARTLAGWDVIQYEFGPAWPDTRDLPGRFPDQWHIFHSCLTGAPESAGKILKACVTANLAGTVLFSTTRLSHLRDNVQAVLNR